MDEDNKEEIKTSEFKVEVDKDELKNQTKDAVNQVKETIKNVDFKKDASATKGFALEMIKKPFSTIKDVVTEKENRFSIAVILMICLMVANGLDYAIMVGTSKYMEFKFVTFLIRLIAPLVYVLAFSIAVVLFGGTEKKSITTMLAGITIGYAPRIAASLMGIIYSIINVNIVGYINTIVSNSISFLSIALIFTAIKDLISKEDDEDKEFRKIAVIAVVAFVILKVLAICGIY